MSETAGLPQSTLAKWPWSARKQPHGRAEGVTAGEGSGLDTWFFPDSVGLLCCNCQVSGL